MVKLGFINYYYPGREIPINPMKRNKAKKTTKQKNALVVIYVVYFRVVELNFFDHLVMDSCGIHLLCLYNSIVSDHYISHFTHNGFHGCAAMIGIPFLRVHYFFIGVVTIISRYIFNSYFVLNSTVFVSDSLQPASMYSASIWFLRRLVL